MRYKSLIQILIGSLVIVGCASTAVPDVVGLTEEEATDQIQEAGFDTRSVEVRDDKADEGTVVRTRPSPGSDPEPESEVLISVAAAPKPLVEAWEDCDADDISFSSYPASLEDGGTTALLPGRGKDDSTEERAAAMVVQFCMIERLGTRESIVSRIESTRALDGVQSADADGLSYTWSYHPNSGLNLIIEELE